MRRSGTGITRRQLGQGSAALLGAVAVGAGQQGQAGATEDKGAGPKEKKGPGRKPPDVDSAELEAILREVAADHDQPAIAAAVIRGTSVRAMAVTGEIAAGGGEPVTLDSRFHIASVTKRLTATLIARLVQDGALDWETTLRDALPGVSMRTEFEAKTIRDVLLHRAGMVAWTTEEDRVTVQKLWYDIPGEHPDPPGQRLALTEYVLSLPLLGMPPAEWHTYQNVGYSMLGHIAEVAVGRSYEELMAEYIFEPLGMSGARIGGWPTSDGEDQQPRGHHAAELPGQSARPLDLDASELPRWLNAAGGVHCPIADLAAFVLDNMRGVHGDGEILDTAGYETLHAPQARVDLATMYPSMNRTGTVTMGYGCAFGETDLGQMTAFNGSTGTFVSTVSIVPAARIAFAGCANAGDGIAALSAVQERVTGIGNG